MNKNLAPIDTSIASGNGPASMLLDALPHPIIMIDGAGHVAEANSAAQDFFQASIAVLRRRWSISSLSAARSSP